MTDKFKMHVALLSLGAIAISFMLAVPGLAQSRFDGTWSVKISVESGDCDTQMISIAVQNGQVAFSGFGATADGAITPAGIVNVSLTDGYRLVKVSGTVRGGHGSGRWRSPKCTGSWAALKNETAVQRSDNSASDN